MQSLYITNMKKLHTLLFRGVKRPNLYTPISMNLLYSRRLMLIGQCLEKNVELELTFMGSKLYLANIKRYKIN